MGWIVVVSRLHTLAGTGLSQRRQWIVVFLGFFLVFGAWSFAAPYDGPADEVQHVIRAVGVVSGQLTPAPAVVRDFKGNPGMGAYQQVPKGLLQHAVCWGFNPRQSAACGHQISGGPIGNVPTTAGRYNPTYYALVGLPLKLSPSWGGLVAARLISGALSASLLAFAFVVLSRWSRYGLMLAGLIAAATPMLAHLAGAVNPNGLEIASGISLFSAAIPLLLGPPRGRLGPLLWLAAVSAAVLTTLRSLGPMWVFFAALALLLPVPRQAIGRLWRLRLTRWLTGVVAAATVLSLLWIVVMKTGGIIKPAHPGNYSVFQATLIYLDNWGNSYLDGMVGVAGWFDVFMPSPFYWLWIGLAGSLVVFAIVISGWADRWRFVAMFIGGVVMPGIMQVREANSVGFIIGGRYMLPLLVGMPLLAAFIVERSLITARHARSFIRLFCVILLPIHLVLLVYAMVRWQRGTSGRSPNPLSGTWHPPTGSITPLLLMVVGLVVVGWAFWTAPARIAARPEAAAAEPDAAEAPVGDADFVPERLPASPKSGNGGGHQGNGSGVPGAMDQPRSPVLDPR
jgi:Predicted membrane protein (DUF2142)